MQGVFTATVLQPGWYRPAHGGQRYSPEPPKTLQISLITGHTRTGCNGRHRIVALEEVAGSSPVGHLLSCRINATVGERGSGLVALLGHKPNVTVASTPDGASPAQPRTTMVDVPTVATGHV